MNRIGTAWLLGVALIVVGCRSQARDGRGASPADPSAIQPKATTPQIPVDSPTSQPEATAPQPPAGFTARGLMKLVQRAQGPEDRFDPTDARAVQRFQDEAAVWMRAEWNLDALLRTSDATRLAWYRLHEQDKDPMAETLRRQLSVQPVANSMLIEVSVTDPDADAAVEMCNFLMRFCEKRSQVSQFAHTEDQKRLLMKELEGISTRLNAVTNALKKIRQSTDLENPERNRDEVADRVIDLRRLRMTQELQVANLERLVQLGSAQPDVLNELEAARAKLKEISADLAASEERKRKLDTVWAQSQGMQLELEQLEADRKRLENRLKPLPLELPANHPPVEVFSPAAVPRER